MHPNNNSQFEYSQEWVTDEIKRFSLYRKITIIAYSVLLNGAYIRSDRKIPPQFSNENNKQRLHTLKFLAKNLNITTNQLVLFWLLHHEVPIIPILGVGTVEQLQENLNVEKLHLDHEIIRQLNNIT